MLRIFTLLGLLVMLLPAPSAHAASPYPQPTGFAFISQVNDYTQQKMVIREARANFIRIPVQPGFGNTPSVVDDMVRLGVTHIVLQSRGCDVQTENVTHDIISQGYRDKIVAYPQVQFYIEIGNEPDNFCDTPITPADYAARTHTTLRTLKPQIPYSNVRWALGLGASHVYTDAILSEGTYRSFDVLAQHLYGHQSFADSSERSWFDTAYQRYGKPIIITEIGINGDIGFDTKAQRYREFALQPPPGTEGMAFWTVDPAYAPQYAISARMAQIMAGVTPSECFPQTGYCIGGGFQAFWHSTGLDLGDAGISFRESLMLWGYPLSGEFVSEQTGHVTQVFERMVFEWHPENPDPYKVMLRLMGAERCAEVCPR